MSSSLYRVHQRLDEDIVLAAMLAMCRREAAHGHGELDINIFDVWRELSDCNKSTTDDTIYSCVGPLQTMGFNVVSYPDTTSTPTISIYFPWTPLPSSIPDDATVHAANARAPWRLVITPEREHDFM